MTNDGADMGSGQAAKAALVTFDRGDMASRRIAGVAAAARIARELDEAGFADARFVLPAGERLSESALADLDRLAGALNVEVVSATATERAAGPAGEALRIRGDRLVPARLLSGLGAGAIHAVDPAIIRLDAPSASAEILRRTGKASDGPVSRWLNRPVSRRISLALLRIPGLGPNHATALAAVLGGLMFAALILGGARGLVAGALLYQASSIVDGVDGEMARATFRSSRAGAILDAIVDVATNLLFIIGLTLNLAWSGHGHALAFAGWGFTMFVLGLAMIAWTSWRTGGPFSLDLVKEDYRGRFAGRLVPGFIRAATIVTSHDFFALASMLLILAGLPMVILYSFAPVTTIWILFVLGTLATSTASGRLRVAGRKRFPESPFQIGTGSD